MFYLYYSHLSSLLQFSFVASIRTKHKMTGTTDDTTRGPEQDEQPELLTEEQFNQELDDDLRMLLDGDHEEATDERGAEGSAGQGDEEDDEDADEDEEEGYVSPEDPFPPGKRQRPTEQELDRDFDPNEEVGIKP